MTISVIHAYSSSSVMPGSLALWLVHSGQYRGMRRVASSTICFHERSSRFGTGRDMMATSMKLLAACQIEREDEVVDRIGGADLVAHVDENPLRRVRVGHGLDLDVADAVLIL